MQYSSPDNQRAQQSKQGSTKDSKKASKTRSRDNSLVHNESRKRKNEANQKLTANQRFDLHIQDDSELDHLQNKLSESPAIQNLKEKQTGYEPNQLEKELANLPRGDFVNNADKAGNTIVSRITNTLGSLKTLSAYIKEEGDDGNRNFNLFTHHKLLKEKKPLQFTYDALKEAVLELYLSVKIRSDEEIDNYNEEFFKDEKHQLRELDGFTLIDYIKTSIEILMNMKVEEQDEMENPELFTNTSNSLRQLKSPPKNRHERSAPRQRRSENNKPLQIDKKLIEIDFGKHEQNEADDIAASMPNMGAIDVDRSPREDKSGLKQRSSQRRQNDSSEKQGIFEKSPSSTVKDLERKLQMIGSPSESKVSSSNTRNEQEEDTESQSSIPPAHKEYEKLLRQLEAECRNHIRCEQQMKLHIECLQEKIDAQTKEQNKLKQAEQQIEEMKGELAEMSDLSKKVEKDYAKAQADIQSNQKKISQLEIEKAKLVVKLKDKEEAIEKLKEQLKKQQKINQQNLDTLSAATRFAQQAPIGVQTGTNSITTSTAAQATHNTQGNQVKQGNKQLGALFFQSQDQKASVTTVDKRKLPDYTGLLKVSPCSHLLLTHYEQQHAANPNNNSQLKSLPTSNKSGFHNSSTNSKTGSNNQQYRSQSVLKPASKAEIITGGSPHQNSVQAIIDSQRSTSTQKRNFHQRNASQALISALIQSQNSASVAELQNIHSERHHHKVSSRSTNPVTNQQTSHKQQLNSQSNPYNSVNNFATSYNFGPNKKKTATVGPQQLAKTNNTTKIKTAQGRNVAHKKTKSTFVQQIANQNPQASLNGLFVSQATADSSAIQQKTLQENLTSGNRNGSDSKNFRSQSAIDGIDTFHKQGPQSKIVAEHGYKPAQQQMLHQSQSQRQVAQQQPNNAIYQAAHFTGSGGKHQKEKVAMIQQQMSQNSLSNFNAIQNNYIASSVDQSHSRSISIQQQSSAQAKLHSSSINQSVGQNENSSRERPAATGNKTLHNMSNAINYESAQAILPVQQTQHARNKSELNSMEVKKSQERFQRRKVSTNDQGQMLHVLQPQNQTQHRHGTQGAANINKQKQVLKHLQQQIQNNSITNDSSQQFMSKQTSQSYIHSAMLPNPKQTDRNQTPGIKSKTQSKVQSQQRSHSQMHTYQNNYSSQAAITNTYDQRQFETQNNSQQMGGLNVFGSVLDEKRKLAKKVTQKRKASQGII